MGLVQCYCKLGLCLWSQNPISGLVAVPDNTPLTTQLPSYSLEKQGSLTQVLGP